MGEALLSGSALAVAVAVIALTVRALRRRLAHVLTATENHK